MKLKTKHSMGEVFHQQKGSSNGQGNCLMFFHAHGKHAAEVAVWIK